MGEIYICLYMFNFKYKFMEETLQTSKNYSFYVLVSEDDPENIRYVGVTTRTVNARFS